MKLEEGNFRLILKSAMPSIVFTQKILRKLPSIMNLFSTSKRNELNLIRIEKKRNKALEKERQRLIQLELEQNKQKLIREKEERRIARIKNVETQLSIIDKLSGHEFEYYLSKLFKDLKYDVQVTKGSGDYGADLVMRKNDKKIVVQAKRYNNKKINNSAVQEIHTAKSMYHADEAWVVTNSFYTENAIKLARASKVKLVDRLELKKYLDERGITINQ